MNNKICYLLPFLFNQTEEDRRRRRTRQAAKEEENRRDLGLSGKL